MINVIGQTVVKADNDIFDNKAVRQNEDAFFYRDGIVALSDGAGGTGLFAGKWAKKLVESIPDKPFEKCNCIDEWIGVFWEDFYNEHVDLVRTDAWKLKKFETEGSSATFSGLWSVGNSTYIYESYGDTSLFIYNSKSGSLKIQDNMQSINSFNTNPALLNWHNETTPEEFFFRKEFKLNEDENIIIATDGIAMYLHAAYLVYNNLLNEEITESKMRKIVDYIKKNPITDFKRWMNQLKESLLSIDSFRALTIDWYKNKALPNDDYTVVWVG